MRWRFVLAMLSGDGSVNFLSAMFHPDFKHKNPLNPEIERAQTPFQFIRETACGS